MSLLIKPIPFSKLLPSLLKALGPQSLGANPFVFAIPRRCIAYPYLCPSVLSVRNTRVPLLEHTEIYLIFPIATPVFCYTCAVPKLRSLVTSRFPFAQHFISD